MARSTPAKTTRKPRKTTTKKPTPRKTNVKAAAVAKAEPDPQLRMKSTDGVQLNTALLLRGIRRVEEITERRAGLNADVRSVLDDLDKNGFDKKAVREVIKRRKLDSSRRNLFEDQVHQYELAIEQSSDGVARLTPPTPPVEPIFKNPSPTKIHDSEAKTVPKGTGKRGRKRTKPPADVTISESEDYTVIEEDFLPPEVSAETESAAEPETPTKSTAKEDKTSDIESDDDWFEDADGAPKFYSDEVSARLGKQAYIAGGSLDDCPFDPGSDDFADWTTAWNEAAGEDAPGAPINEPVTNDDYEIPASLQGQSEEDEDLKADGGGFVDRTQHVSAGEYREQMGVGDPEIV